MSTRENCNSPTKGTNEEPPSRAEGSPLHKQSLANQIASCALDHYHEQPTKKGKPKPGEEWTVFAAIVAFHRADNRLWVVSCATGTKCTAQRHNEFILHDSHAEVLARRGLIRVVLSEILGKQQGDTTERNDVAGGKATTSQNLLVENPSRDPTGTEQAPSPGTQYQLDPGIELHFYISDSPCGDASIYRIPSGPCRPKDNNNGILYTGAKVIVSEATKVDATDCGGKHQLLPKNNSAAAGSKNEDDDKSIAPEAPTVPPTPLVAREETQVLGKLRTKSGRSNLPAHMRSHSHSCSDKLVLWGVLGLQGGMLTKFLDPPVIPLSSVVVSTDSRLLVAEDESDNEIGEEHREQQIALERAIPDRVRRAWECLGAHEPDQLPPWKPSIPTVHLVPRIFASGKAAMVVASKAKKLSGKKRKGIGNAREDSLPSETKAKNDGTIKAKKVSPCGMAFNWIQNEDIEVLVGARGIKHGKKPKKKEDIENLSSRLCRSKLLQDFSFLCRSNATKKATERKKPSPATTTAKTLQEMPVSSTLDDRTYCRIKENTARSDWIVLKKIFMTQKDSPLVGWLRSGVTDDKASVDNNSDDSNKYKVK